MSITKEPRRIDTTYTEIPGRVVATSQRGSIKLVYAPLEPKTVYPKGPVVP